MVRELEKYNLWCREKSSEWLVLSFARFYENIARLLRVREGERKREETNRNYYIPLSLTSSIAFMWLKADDEKATSAALVSIVLGVKQEWLETIFKLLPYHRDKFNFKVKYLLKTYPTLVLNIIVASLNIIISPRKEPQQQLTDRLFFLIIDFFLTMPPTTTVLLIFDTFEPCTTDIVNFIRKSLLDCSTVWMIHCFVTFLSKKFQLLVCFHNLLLTLLALKLVLNLILFLLPRVLLPFTVDWKLPLFC